MNIKTRLVGHAAGFAAYVIFGFNIIVCKDLSTSSLISPLGLFCVRSVTATVLYWLLSMFFPSEKIEKRDFLYIFMASMLGLFFTQMSFLEAIVITTPMDTSIVTACTPIFTMLVAAVALKEPITWKKVCGVLLSFVGIVMLILNSVSMENGVVETKPMGLVLMLLNGFCFALYLGIFKPLIEKYSVVTFMKWMFLFSALVTIPFEVKEFARLQYASIHGAYAWELAYLIVFSTFLAYLLIPIGQKYLRPTVLSMYSYLQPIIASMVSICIGMDVLSWQKIAAASAVFIGVILVNKSRAAVR